MNPSEMCRRCGQWGEEGCKIKKIGPNEIQDRLDRGRCDDAAVINSKSGTVTYGSWIRDKFKNWAFVSASEQIVVEGMIF